MIINFRFLPGKGSVPAPALLFKDPGDAAHNNGGSPGGGRSNAVPGFPDETQQLLYRQAFALHSAMFDAFTTPNQADMLLPGERDGIEEGGFYSVNPTSP